jgi:carbamoyl-phosphate synthase small subunit
LNRHKIPVLWDIDTRALVRHLRLHGALRGMVATDGTPAEQLIHEAKLLPSMAGQELASRVSTEKGYKWEQGSIELASSPWSEQMGEAGAGSESGRKLRVAAYDFGIKQNILRLLVDHGCEVVVVPAQTPAEDVLALGADGVFLSNGPGDPEPATYAVENIRKMLGKVPVFGICLGHQLCGLALGGKTFKLKFGHHGFCVDPESLPSSDVEVTHLNLNDHTNEGFRHKSLPLFSVQYHPEASPGPHDSHYLFTQFTDLMKEFAQPGSSR